MRVSLLHPSPQIFLWGTGAEKCKAAQALPRGPEHP